MLIALTNVRFLGDREFRRLAAASPGEQAMAEISRRGGFQ
jgi:hypothetical protein